MIARPSHERSPEPLHGGLRLTERAFFELPGDGWTYELIGSFFVPKIESEFSHDTPPKYNGLRMTVAEYASLPEDGYWYELIQEVVVSSPGPGRMHQDIAGLLYFLLRSHIEAHPGGTLLYEVDVTLGFDEVYRPNLCYFAPGRLDPSSQRIEVVPDLIIESVSVGSAARDLNAKRDTYERAGVREYIVVDPIDRRVVTFRRSAGQFVQAAAGQVMEIETIPGLSLDLARVRAAFG